MTEKLQRHIGLGALIVYGIGDILGAGIYGLIGKGAGEMGNAIWLAFLTSLIAASLTAFSYASLGSRYPAAGGAAYITHRAFRNNFIAYVVGLAALASGLTSMAAGSRAFAGYFVGLTGLSSPLPVIFGFGLLLAAVVIRGIRESLWMNMVCTAIELGGLLLLLVVGARYIGAVNYMDAVTPTNPSGELSFSLVVSGAVLTFYSFIGFEDIINVSEEVKEPKRNVPLGILGAVGVSSLIYVGLSLVAVSVVPAAQLAASPQPLVEVVKVAAPWFPPVAYSFIAMFAVANTALLNFVMGSRLMFGMSRQELLPKALSRLGKKTKTPYVAALTILVIMLGLALSGDISSLARATAVLLLMCFFFVNLSLVILKMRPQEEPGKFEVPLLVPIAGALVCATMLFYSKREELKLAAIILTGIVALYIIMRPKASAIEHLDELSPETTE